MGVGLPVREHVAGFLVRCVRDCRVSWPAFHKQKLGDNTWLGFDVISVTKSRRKRRGWCPSVARRWPGQRGTWEST